MMSKTVGIVYDRPVDVLHLVIGAAQAYEGDGFPGGIEIDYSSDTGEPCGAKVIGFRRNGWADRRKELAHVLSSHLRIKDHEVMTALRSI